MDAMISAFDASFKSKRLTFIPMSDDDKPFMYTEIWSRPQHCGLASIAVLRPITRKESDARVDEIIKDAIITVSIHLTAELNDSADADKSQSRIGYLSLRKFGGDGIAYFRCASIGMGFAVPHQNKGYGRETLEWVLDYAFGYVNLRRIEIGTVSFNERAIALYKSVGFVEEGRRRKSTFANMQWHDQVNLAMLDEEYDRLRKDHTRAT